MVDTVSAKTNIKWRKDVVKRLTEQEVAMLIQSFALHVKADAKQNHTFKNRSGNLEASIDAEKVESGNPVKVIWRVFAGGTKAPYAVFVELGTRFMKALPFLVPAFHRQSKKLNEFLKSMKMYLARKK